MQSLISARINEGVQAVKWVEFVQDLWTEEKLKHLRDFAMPGYDDNVFQFDPSTQLYGFQEGIDTEEEAFLFTHTEHPEEDSESPVASAEETPQPASTVGRHIVAVAPPSTFLCQIRSLKPLCKVNALWGKQ